MIHELRTYTLWPGKVPAFLKLAEEKARPIRGNDYGTMEGYWFTEVGALNQVVHLWSYDDLNARQDARDRLAQNKAWREEYTSQVFPLIQKQEIRLLHPRMPLKPPANTGNIYEYRYYRTATGKAGEFIANMVEAMPARERYSQNVCLWQSEAAQPNEVSHLWAYESFEARMAARGESVKDDEWRAFLAKGGALLEEMHSLLLIPAPFSPLT